MNASEPKTRWLMAYDGQHVFLREILCTIHHGESGEIEYHSKPIKPVGLMRVVMFLFGLAAARQWRSK